MTHPLRMLRAWFRRRAAARLPRPTNLRVEVLEDRLAPAASFGSLIGLDAAQAAYPYRGTGYTVAVLDSGIDYNHPDLGGGWGKRVVAGYDFVNNDADPMDDNGHGTHIAGIIGSSSTTFPGIAPDVHFVALKVLDANNSGSWENVDRALQWVIDHRAQYNIIGVNLSMSGGNYASNPSTYLESDFSSLKSQGVFLSLSSGNSFYTYNSQPGLGYPSISSNVVSVGAVWTDNFGKVTFSSGATDYTTAPDRIVSMTQRGPNLSLLAPGAWITSTWKGGGFQAMGGTSMAAAVVSGSAVVIHQALVAQGQPTNQDAILGLMQQTGTTIVDGDDENDNVVNTGLSFKRLNLKAALDAVGLPNAPPTLAAIANQTLPSGGSVVVPLSASDPDGDSLTFTARIINPAALAYQLDQQLGLSFSGNYSTNSVGANEKWLQGSGGTSYILLPNGELCRWTGSLTETLAPAALVGTLDSTYYDDPTKLWNATPAQFPPVSLTFNGAQLTLRETTPFTGSFMVEVSVSDGQASAKRTFTVTATSPAPAPVWTPISARSMSHAQDTMWVALQASAPQGQTVSYSARVLPINGLTPAVALRLSGKYLTIDPDRSFAGTFTIEATARAGTASATQTFTVRVWNYAPQLTRPADVTLSQGAPRTIALSARDPDGDVVSYTARVLTGTGQTAPAAVSVQGNQLTITPVAGFAGTFTVEVTASDGAATNVQSFRVTVPQANTPPTLAAIPTQTLAAGQTVLTLALSGADADGDTLTYTAALQPPSAQAYQLDQQLGLSQANGSYYTNLWGQNEKWLIGTGNLWYTLMPDGRLYRWAGTMTATLQAANLIATFDAQVYAEPRLLWQALPPTPPLTVTVTGNQLKVTRPANQLGVVFVQANVSDGSASAQRTFMLVMN